VVSTQAGQLQWWVSELVAGLVGDLLAEVRSGAPAAMVLVNVATACVVYANPPAGELTAGLALPASVDAWSDAAVLRDLGVTGDLSRTDHPLSRVARSLPVGGQAVTAARATALGRIREPLWMVGLPLSGAPGLDGHALIVFLPLREQKALVDAGHAASADTARQVRERAVLATGMSFTVADAQAADLPLIWVNPAFTSTTGFSPAEAVGRNCRFLQGPGTDPAAVAGLRDGLVSGRDATATVLNYRKDGTAFWNQCTLSPIYDPAGVLTHYVGIQADVTARVAADTERDCAVAAERTANARIALLAQCTTVLAGTLDVAESFDRLAGLLVPLVADWVLLVGAADDDGPGATVTRDRDGRHHLLRWTQLVTQHPGADEPLRRLFAGGRAQRLTADLGADPSADGGGDMNGDIDRHIDGTGRARWGGDPAMRALGEQLGAAAALLVPLPARGQIAAAMMLIRHRGRPVFTDTDLDMAVDLGRRAGVSLDNARLYQREHRIAETLQRSLLPDLPDIATVTAAARYRASANTAQVGGDFYELLDLPDGAIGVAIGDVVGHDLHAAAAMGQLRGLLRACAWDVEQYDGRHPDAVLARVDRLLQGLHATSMATLAFARLEPPGYPGDRHPTPGTHDTDTAPPDTAMRRTGRWRVQYSSAGHPPLMLRLPDGRVQLLDEADGLLLGVQPTTRPTAQLTVPRGTTLLAYTDGLIERRAEHLDTGITPLAELLHTHRGTTPDQLCDRILHDLGASDDDVALLAVQLH